MIHGRRLWALVPARGGSKGIPRKNLYRVNGETLVERAVRLARGNPAVDDVLVSTDDAEIYGLATRLRCATPQPRPAQLATDAARTIDIVTDLVQQGTLGSEDCVVLLQPTTPLRTDTDLAAVCALLDERWLDADAVVSVADVDGPHPFKAQTIGDQGYLRSLLGRDAAVPRQSLPRALMPNGAFYMGKLDALLREDTFMPARSLPYVMSARASINLDGPLDLLLLEAVLSAGRV